MNGYLILFFRRPIVLAIGNLVLGPILIKSPLKNNFGHLWSEVLFTYWSFGLILSYFTKSILI